MRVLHRRQTISAPSAKKTKQSLGSATIELSSLSSCTASKLRKASQSQTVKATVRQPKEPESLVSELAANHSADSSVSVPSTSSPLSNELSVDGNDNTKQNVVAPCGTCQEAVVPNAAEWTAQQVFEYFEETIPAVARAMLEKQIDGCGLLLMTLKDVLDLVKQTFVAMNGSLAEAFDVAFDLHAHVVRLQTRSNDIRKC